MGWSRALVIAAGLVLTVAAIVGAAVLGRSLEARRIAPASQPQVAASPASSPVQTTGAPSSSATASPQPAPAVLPGVSVHPLGAVRGEVVFAARIVEGGTNWGMHEVWAVPLADGAAARVVLTYQRSPVSDAWPPRYLSPDGRRYAFEADRGDGVHRIAIADLFSGQVQWLSTDDSAMDDRQPMWDPSGRRIAFTRGSNVRGQADQGLWLVNADGTGLRQLVAGSGGVTYLYHWTPDGRAIAFAEGVGHAYIDPDTGSVIRTDNVVSGDVSLRDGVPPLVAHGWEAADGGDLQYIFTAVEPDGPRATVLKAATTMEFLSAPRWRPGTDEFLYMRSLKGEREIRVRDLSGNDRLLVKRSAISPTWSLDGASVVYIHSEEVPEPTPSPCAPAAPVCPGYGVALVTTELRTVRAEGSDDRSLFRLAPPGDTKTPGWCVCNEGLTIRRY